MIEVTPANPILQSLQDLGQLSTDSGLHKVKPFRDWKGNKWQNKTFTYRLCNAGEIFDILEYASNFPEYVHAQITKTEILIRAIWSIDERPLITDAELKTYNDQHRSKLSDKDYLRMWVRNVENIVIERLYSIYEALQAKQIRQLNGILLCPECGMTYGDGEVPDGSFKLETDVADIICANCAPHVNEDKYDFKTIPESPVVTPTPEESKSENPIVDVPAGQSFDYQSYVCACGKECSTLEEFAEHRQTCPKAQ